jgi:hypothetical protein
MQRSLVSAARGARRLAACVAIASIQAAALLSSCSSSNRAGGVGGAEFRPPSERGTCTPGQTRSCGIEVGSHDGYVDCVAGTQTCLANRAWSGCVASGASYARAAPSPKGGSDGPAPSTKVVVGGASVCADDPCNPYCHSLDDAPDGGITSDAVVTTVAGATITIDEVAAGAIPSGFVDKGTLDAWCDPAVATPAQQDAACQFDQRCAKRPDGTFGCVPWREGESGGCRGIDLTAPPVCAPSASATSRNLGICNRGTQSLEQNVRCMGYPGNKPQYPNDDPGLGMLVLDTSTSTTPIDASHPLEPGECRTFSVPSSNFAAMGTESIMCNVPNALGATTAIESVGTSVVGDGWTDPTNAVSDLDLGASATFGFSRSAVTRNASAAAWIAGWTSPSRLTGAADGGYAQAEFLNVKSATRVATTLLGSTCTSAACTPWTSIDATGGAASTPLATQLQGTEGNRIRAALTPDDVVTATLGGFTFPEVPASAAVSAIEVTVKWSSETNRCSGVVRVRKSDGSLVGSFSRMQQAFGDVSNPAGDVTQTATIVTSALTPADLSGLRVELEAARTSAGGGVAFVLVDHLGLSIEYATPPQSATLEAEFPAISLPSGATPEAMMVTPIWNLDDATAQHELGIQPVLATGVALPEQTRTLPATYVPPTAVVSTLVWTDALTAASFGSGFKLRVRATRKAGAPNPSYRLGIDALSVSAFSSSGPSTATLELSNFGFKVPTTASKVELRTFVRYQATPATTNDRLGLEAYAGTTRLQAGEAAAPATSTEIQVGGPTAVAPSDLEDPRFRVKLTGARRLPQTGSTTHAVDYVKAIVTYTGDVSGQVLECNGSNNWTVSKSNPAIVCPAIATTVHPPWTVTRLFVGSCPSGTRPRWRRFGFETTTPTGTRVDFRFRAFARDAAGTCAARPAALVDPPAPLATARTSPTDTQTCDLSAAPTASCPVDLTTGLGADAGQDCLQMDARGVPTVLPAPAAPTLEGWRVTYDCVPSE